MSKDPAVLFYTADFLVGVSDMPYLERGYYITLLCLQHQKGHLSEETICFSLGLRSVSEIPLVMSHFKVDDEGKFFQKRMEEESIKRCKYSESRKNNGSMGGRPKAQNDNHMQNHMDTHMEDENDNSNKGVKGGKKTPHFEHDSKPYKCAAYLDTEMVKRMPSKKHQSEDNLQKWADAFDKLNRIDDYGWDLISYVLEKLQDVEYKRLDFWRGQIMSGSTFREKFDKLYAITGEPT